MFSWVLIASLNGCPPAHGTDGEDEEANSCFVYSLILAVDHILEACSQLNANTLGCRLMLS